MRFNGMMQLAISVAILLCAPSIGTSQAMCGFNTQKISRVSGRAVIKKEGAPNAKIELRTRDDAQELIRTLSSDDEGNFEIDGLKNGKYYLWVKLELFADMMIPIDLNKDKKKRPGRLVVHLAPEVMNPCAEGGVELSLLPFGTYRPLR